MHGLLPKHAIAFIYYQTFGQNELAWDWRREQCGTLQACMRGMSALVGGLRAARTE